MLHRYLAQILSSVLDGHKTVVRKCLDENDNLLLARQSHRRVTVTYYTRMKMEQAATGVMDQWNLGLMEQRNCGTLAFISSIH